MLKSNEPIKIGSFQYTISYEEPDVCPACKYAIQPYELSRVGYIDNDNVTNIVFTYLCKKCFHPFIALYDMREDRALNGSRYAAFRFMAPNRFSPQEFDPSISSVSPSFVEIYNQALAAESYGLNQVAGVGYRKALEFLIKDFLISQDPSQKETIERMELGNCIANKVSFEKLRIVASRSAWLGNDQAHYVQKFDDYDIEDMKRFIKSAVFWISSELTTAEAMAIEPMGR